MSIGDDIVLLSVLAFRGHSCGLYPETTVIVKGFCDVFAPVHIPSGLLSLGKTSLVDSPNACKVRRGMRARGRPSTEWINPRWLSDTFVGLKCSLLQCLTRNENDFFRELRIFCVYIICQTPLKLKKEGKKLASFGSKIRHVYE